MTVPIRQLSQKEREVQWKIAIQTTDEIVENYRETLVGMGVSAGKMLDRFLDSERTKILRDAKGLLDQAQHGGEGTDSDRYKYRTVGVAGEYGFDSLVKEYGLFCMSDISGWIKDINPNYYSPFVLPDSNPYHENCGSCAFAVYTRLSGGDALVATENNIGSDFGMETATGKQCVYMSLEKIEDYLRKQGPGSHLIVGINRRPTPNGRPQAGHWFNAFFDGVNFHTIDGQSGEILEWPYDYGDISEWCALV